MLLRDPYALHTISRTVLQTLHKMVAEHKLPRVSSEVERMSSCQSCHHPPPPPPIGKQVTGEFAEAAFDWSQVTHLLRQEGLLWGPSGTLHLLSLPYSPSPPSPRRLIWLCDFFLNLCY